MLDFASLSMAWPRWVKRLAVAGADTMLAIIAVWIAFSLRLGEWHQPDGAQLQFSAAMIALWFPIALWRGNYRSIFRFSGRGAMVSLALSAALLTVPLMALFMAVPQPGVPRTLAIMVPLVFVALIALLRIVGRYVMVDLFTTRPGDQAIKHVLIYGAGATGQRLAGALAAEDGMRLVGFVDDDADKSGHFLDGARVHNSANIATVIDHLAVSDIVIAISNISAARRRQIIAALAPLPVNVQTLPPMRDLMAGRINAEAIRPIEVEDLLGRSVVPEHGDLLARPVAGKLVMVTGAGGSIGSEICRQIIAQRPAGLILVEANEFALFEIGQELKAALDQAGHAMRPALHQRLVDVSNPAAVARLFGEFAPQVVFHAAAYKLFCAANNIRGGRDLRFSVVRYGNVMGSRGSVIPFFLSRKRSGTLPITDERMTRFNISLDEGVEMVLWSLEHAKGGEILVPKIPSYRIGDVADAVAPEAEKQIVGIRPGEKIHEEMITSSDSFSTVDMGRYYAILPVGGEDAIADYCSKYGGKPVQPGFVYNSGSNPDFLSVAQLKQLIEQQVAHHAFD